MATEKTSPPSIFAERTNNRYVGFCDILGFSDRILHDFDGTLDLYKALGWVIQFGLSERGVKISMYSDAMLITGDSIDSVMRTIQSLWFSALSKNFMLRGAITKGRYWEHHQGNHMLVVSDALVSAVRLEKSIGIPAVVVADDIEIPDDIWVRRFAGVVNTPVLHFQGKTLVNPFSTFWCNS